MLWQELLFVKTILKNHLSEFIQINSTLQIVTKYSSFNCIMPRSTGLNLDKLVKCEKDVQVIGLASVMKKSVDTLLVMSTFFI